MGRLRHSSQGVRARDRRVPLARAEDLVIEELEDELLVYDRRNQSAHCLGATAARVWRACDGSGDVDGLADALGLSRDTVLRALEELDAAGLLDVPELQVLNGDGNGEGITRRHFTLSSAKIGVAAAAAPLMYSIAVPAPAAAATPTAFQCEIYSVSSCGSNYGAGAIAGCCCCCSCSGTSCQLGTAVDVCNAGAAACATNCGQPGCSNVGTIAPTSSGCCGLTGANYCGCAFSPRRGSGTGYGPGSAGSPCGTPQGPPECANNCGSGSGQVPPGGPGCGAGCCDITAEIGGIPCTETGNCPGCTPNAALAGRCVPCCNGTPLTENATFGCCVPGATDTCGGTPRSAGSGTRTGASAGTNGSATGTSAATNGGSTGSAPASRQGDPSTTTCVVPHLRGDTLAHARRALASHHCSLGHVKHRRSRKRNRGRVIAQSVKPGKTLRAGHAIGVTVGREK